MLEEIGYGGMATVYRARDKRLGREVAVKIIHRHLRENREVAQRFASEARAVAKLKHPNIVEVYDVSDAAEEERYLVAELVRGTTLRKLIQTETYLPPEIAAAIGIEVAEALDHAHQLGVIHRDVKPENVLVATPVGPGPGSHPDPIDIKITDFGIAKLLDAQGVTSTGQVLGSPAHMAPEQIEGGDVTARADVFGLGVLLYECLVGRLPFDGKNPAQVLRRVLEGAFTPAERARPTVGTGHSAIVSRALAHEPKDRFATTAELSRALATELTAMGFESSRRELHAFLVDPRGYRIEHEERIVTALEARATAAKEQRDYLLAAAHYNRALAYRPGDPELLSSVSTLAKGERLRRSARRVAIILSGSMLVAAGALGVVRVTLPEPAAQVPSARASAAPLPAPSGRRAAPVLRPVESASSVTPPVRRAPASRPSPTPSQEVPEFQSGIARVRILVQGPKNATVRIDGVETAWFGELKELSPGKHLFEFLPPDDRCCVSEQRLERVLAPSDGPDDFEIIRGQIDYRPATLQLTQPAGGTASCGVLGQFPVPSVQEIPMPDGPIKVSCLLFPPAESPDPPKQFDVTLNPGRTSMPLGQ